MKKVSGTTIDEAVTNAASQLGITKTELKYRVIQQPRHGFLGIGKRNAIIEVSTPVNKQVNEHHRPQSVKAVIHKASHESSKHRKEQPTTHQTKLLDEKEKLALQAKESHARNLQRMQRVSKGLVKYLTDSLAALGIKGQVKVEQLRVHDLKLVIDTDHPSWVVGFHGRRINALESLGATYLNYHGVKDAQLILDTGNYRERRRKALQNLMADSVTEVIATNQAVFLDPMPARERKMLHKLAETSSAVKTYSHGKEPFRSVVIAPRN